jgi:hypothetical protein
MLGSRRVPRVGGVARPAVQHEHDRIAAILPRVVTHCSMPPTFMYLASSMPFGDEVP